MSGRNLLIFMGAGDMDFTIREILKSDLLEGWLMKTT